MKKHFPPRFGKTLKIKLVSKYEDAAGTEYDATVEAALLWKQNTAKGSLKVKCMHKRIKPGYNVGALPYNKRYNRITVSFEDGGVKTDTSTVVKELWGGIAGAM